jgi:hypothetical protein
VQVEAGLNWRCRVPGHKNRRLGLHTPGNGMWDNFADGNSVALVHGAKSPRTYDPVADAILAEIQAHPESPEYLSRPLFAHSLRGWAVAEAKLLLIEQYMEQIGVEAVMTAVGAQSPVIMHWKQLSEHAARLRARNGLDPVSFVKIGKALTSAGVDLARLAMLEHGDDSDFDG